ncbi:hypothetical protein RO3G_05432 [Rhizopus delemar RA 99-880]|uniref:Uncharacterized protein n=1 Tax=Rhizopus delemar (strain RA 99-880 / ATCC MYA-4621 / FGSC 9543 / NRRL 43880) TaxID=246409 RepID=I1BWZ7_RHIO9|nr:hypothetical protein RO3G_05432 [Rhizopus delemar RA 99-880]|eukprot:EIE80727.1 hypothetical protein RO3G_05432 [Rhizopus delemar RA 99-880]
MSMVRGPYLSMMVLKNFLGIVLSYRGFLIRDNLSASTLLIPLICCVLCCATSLGCIFDGRLVVRQNLDGGVSESFCV